MKKLRVLKQKGVQVSNNSKIYQFKHFCLDYKSKLNYVIILYLQLEEPSIDQISNV